jgi:HEAT repeat protein
VPELGSLGSVRGALGNERPYREHEQPCSSPTTCAALDLGCSISNWFPLAYFKSEGNVAHVFISYVRENRDVVDRLASELRDRGVTVWLDRNNIYPGTRWRYAIRKAIQSGNFFIACFSKESNERDETHMNEELTIAIDRLRKRSPEKAWFIPVVINETQIPSRFISEVEELSDIQAIILHENWDAGIDRILRVLRYDDPVLARIWKLLEIFDGPFIDERRHAIEQLSGLGVAEKVVIVALIKAAKDKDLEIKKTSLEALGNIGPAAVDAVPALAAALKDPDQYVQRYAAEAIGKIGRGGVVGVPALTDALKNHPEDDIRKYAATALGRIGLGDAVPALAAALNDPDKDVQVCAAEALGNIGPAAADAVPALAAVLNDPKRYVDPRQHVQQSAADALGKIGPADAVPALVAAIKYSSGFLQYHAAEALGKIGPADADAVSALVAALNETNLVVQHYVAEALGNIGPAAANAVPALVAVLKSRDRKGRDRKGWAAEALGKIGPPALTALLTVLNDTNEELRVWAAIALGKIGPAAPMPRPPSSPRSSGQSDTSGSTPRRLGRLGRLPCPR